MSWTDDRIAALKRLWEGGATASQIADELTGVSRNAVIGKAHRLGLKARPSPVKPNENKVKPLPAAEPAGRASSAAPPVVEEAGEAAAEYSAPPAPVKAARPDYSEQRVVQPVKSADAEPADAGIELEDADIDEMADPKPVAPAPATKIVSVGPGGFLRQGPGDQQPPIPPAPPRRLVPAKPSTDVADKTSLLDLNDKVCRWPMGHPGEPDFHFCGETVNPGFPYCVAHCGRAYQAQLPRGARRPPPPLPFGGPRVR